MKSFLASKSPSCRPGCPSTGCPRRVRMGPAGEGCRRRRLRARDRGTPPAPAPRRGTLRACRVPQAGSGCQVPAACCSCLAPGPVLVRPGGRGARWDHRESVPSSSVAPDPPGWRCFGTALLSSPFLSGPSENRQEFYGLMMVNDYYMIIVPTSAATPFVLPCSENLQRCK